MSEEKRGPVSRFVRRIGGGVRTSLAAVGVVAVASAYLEYKRLKSAADGEDDAETKQKHKKVLLVPFHRLRLVERRSQSWSSQLGDWDKDSDERSMQIEVRELVDLLHHAASDPSIVALYGIFGHGSQLSRTGWADLEEIRSALRVFREAHRRHPEPNLEYEMQVIPRIESKPLYAYADTFSSLADPPNKEYYLASIFTHIHMQHNGELNLLGMLSQQFFLRDFLNKYGITMHVFKHGEYKNAPNMFTEQKLDRAHRENVTNLLENMNEQICDEITHSRSKALLTSWLKQNKKYKQGEDIWKRVHESGTFPALTAWKAGLVDYIPRRDPLPVLLESNEKNGSKKEEVKAAWQHQETDFEKFTASKSIHLKDYAKQIAKTKKIQKRKQQWGEYAKKYPVVGTALSLVGIDVTDAKNAPPKEKVALLYAKAEGGIGDVSARRLVRAIRKIRKDKHTKCVVLRVNSPGGGIVACETVLQELKGLGLPVVVSFGNVSASGGYYISSGADRIFASNKSVTGSIGVFGIRLDLTEIARTYGISVDHVASGDLAATMNPFHPMTRKMKNNIAETVDRYYSQFKNVVAEGRQLSLDHVEAMAKGRVWTGTQAKDNGLVDEIGGLQRAISYAQRTYTSSGTDSEIVVWPHKLSYWERLKDAAEQNDARLFGSILIESLSGATETLDDRANSSAPGFSSPVDWIVKSSSGGLPGTLTGVVFAPDETSAIRCLLNELGDDQDHLDCFPPSFWE